MKNNITKILAFITFTFLIIFSKLYAMEAPENLIIKDIEEGNGRTAVKGKEVAVKDLDLTGKIKQITCANADAVGYLYREDEKTMISFDSLDDITAGSRCEHLKGKTMPLDWSNIFID